MRAWWGVTPPPREWWYGQCPDYWYEERRYIPPIRPMPAPVRPTPVDEERIRKIVREEIAGLPIPFDVPDVPPTS